MDIYRSEKLFDANNIDQEFVRRALALGSKESHCLKYDHSDIQVENTWGGRLKNSKSPIPTMSTWDPSFADKYDKVLTNIVISSKRIDCDVVIWWDGRIQGYYKESLRAQYAAHPIKWINLLLKYGYLINANKL